MANLTEDPMRTRCFLPALVLAAALATAAAGAPIPLNDHASMGQRFSAARPVVSIAVCVPSWSDNEGGLTLTLWDAPERNQVLAREAFTDIRDNAYVELRPPRPLPPGSYYWEVSERTGESRIGLYFDELSEGTANCAFLDGHPDPRRRFLFRVRTGPPQADALPALIEALESGSPERQADACRQLAVYGDATAVPALSRLLADPALCHMARYAMESMPGGDVDTAFRTALDSLDGPPLIGVINSVGVRRDAGASGQLARRLADPDKEVAAAAAAALGEIGTPTAAATLIQVLEDSPTPDPAVFAGALRAAGRLLEDGHAVDAVRLYDRLQVPAAPVPIRVAATRGAVVARGEDGPDLLVALLLDEEPAMRETALWLAQHALPGETASRLLASALATLPEDRKAPWIHALARRGDAATLPVLEAAATAGAGPVRLAAVQALPRFGAAAMPGLLRLLDDEDPDVAQAGREALAALPRIDAHTAAEALLASPEADRRIGALTLIRQLQLATFTQDLAAAVRDTEPSVRRAAAKTLRDLGGLEHIEALYTALLHAADTTEAQAMEHALTATAVRAGDPDRVAGILIPTDPDAATPAQYTAILRILGEVGGPHALDAVLAAAGGPRGEIRTAAVNTLCAWPDPAAAPGLLRLAQNPENPTEQHACLQSAIRLAGHHSLPTNQRLELLDSAEPLIQRDEEKLLLLSTLGNISSPDALDRAIPHLDAPATREEACAAILAIAESLTTTPQAAYATPALAHVAKITSNPDFAARARNLLPQSANDP
jgi:prepilin-type processing-associated H-X9-DG protein